ncbi:MAG: Hpt domain-containing protein [Flavobacteriaceae bacterium]|jgi:HPt (histidine-containing phosphotransfer) domain-containing protein|nr:Hpt domain-containing protein [Flavobacteriaceae bacterium]
MKKKYSIENLTEIADGNKYFMRIVVKTFLEEIPPDHKKMEEAIENDNTGLAYQFAHKIKPNLEMFGLNLGKEITAIESHLKKVLATLETVFMELKEDFKL